MKTMWPKTAPAMLSLAAAAFLAAPAFASIPPNPPPGLAEKVRHELVMLPYYTIFDDLRFHVDGNTVTLSGEVVDPVLKSDAGHVIERLAGVGRLVNDIQVLPLSPFDNSIRLAATRAIYYYGPLQRYSMGALPPIHIIVDNGRLTLTGAVANRMDKNLVYIRASGVPGVFSVENDLRVEHP